MPADALTYLTDDAPGIRRLCEPGRFHYRSANGRTVTSKATLQRIQALAIPPAWSDVWIAPVATAHMQATGRDGRGRKQYRYHARCRETQEAAKVEHMRAFVAALPKIRAHIDRDMKKRGLPRERVLAAVVHLLETTLIRVGNGEYAAQNDSYGLTTLRDRHADIAGDRIRFAFKGKSGKTWNLDLKNRRVARIVRQAQDLPGQHLFQYEDADGAPRKISSTDVNAYLREISGADITAKDFRTWAGTVLAAVALAAYEDFDSEAAGKRCIRRAIEDVAQRLGNTPTICRMCYIHPDVFTKYLDGDLRRTMRAAVARAMKAPSRATGLRAEERAVLRLLDAKLAKAR
jgi:DNA topoisomerase-1